MRLFKSFKRHAYDGAIRTVKGIKETDWYNIYNAIKVEYDNTAEAHKKPTEYMRGLAYAMDVLNAVQPYDIAEVK